MTKNLTRNILRVASLLLTLATVCLAFVYGSELIRGIELQKVNLPYIVGAFICFLVFYGTLSIHWRRTCRLFSDTIRSEQLLAFFASQPFKYLPTSMFTFSFRAKFAKEAGLSVRQSSYAQLVENASIISSGLVVGGVMYLFEISGSIAIITTIVSLAVLIWLSNRVENISLPIVRAKLPIGRLSQLFLIACGGWVFAGCAFWLTNTSLGLTVDLAVAISINAIAYVAGIIAFFAPGGIGVRELVLVGGGMTNATIVLWRLLTLIADLVLGIVAMVMLRTGRGSE